MATTNFLNLIAILSLITMSLFLSMHPQPTFSFSFDIEDDDVEEYVLDDPIVIPNQLRARGRMLYKNDKIRKGVRCNAYPKSNICNGVSANNGTGLLYCCKKHCRNVLRDWNNCGQCGNRCKFGERCCDGVCTDVVYNVNHCGKCGDHCPRGVPCDFGYCGYA